MVTFNLAITSTRLGSLKKLWPVKNSGRVKKWDSDSSLQACILLLVKESIEAVASSDSTPSISGVSSIKYDF